MASTPTPGNDAGAGQPPRPGVEAPAPDSPDAWEDWYAATTQGGEDQRASSRPTGTPPLAAAPTPQWRKATKVVTAAAAVLAVFSAGVLCGEFRSLQVTASATSPRTLAPGARAPRTAHPAATVVVQPPSNAPVASRPAGTVRGAPPVRIRIPVLRIDQRLIGLQVNADRQLEVPQHYNDIGWWSTGPVAGGPGAAVVVGHLDSKVGPAVFYRLWSLRKGAAIAVQRADGTTVRFTVTKRQLFSKQHFPDKLVYRTTGRPSLHLVTCGGGYSRSTGYRDNVVVFAELVKPRPAAQPKRRVLPKPAAGHRPASRTQPAKPHPAAKPKAPASSRARKATADPHHRPVAKRAVPHGNGSRGR